MHDDVIASLRSDLAKAEGLIHALELQRDSTESAEQFQVVAEELRTANDRAAFCRQRVQAATAALQHEAKASSCARLAELASDLDNRRIDAAVRPIASRVAAALNEAHTALGEIFTLLASCADKQREGYWLGQRLAEPHVAGGRFRSDQDSSHETRALGLVLVTNLLRCTSGQTGSRVHPLERWLRLVSPSDALHYLGTRYMPDAKALARFPHQEQLEAALAGTHHVRAAELEHSEPSAA